MRTSVFSHTDYAAFRNINRYGAILAVTAPSVFVKHFQKGLIYAPRLFGKAFREKVFTKSLAIPSFFHLHLYKHTFHHGYNASFYDLL